MKKIYLYILLLSFIHLATHAQSTIVVKSQASVGGKVKLRWIIRGDTTLFIDNNSTYLPNVWQRYVNYGFIVERRLSGALPTSAPQRVFTVKPDFDKLLDGSINLPILAERKACSAMKMGIFGTKNELYADSTISTISNDLEVNNRYFGTMVASAISYKGACYAGLGIVDDSALPNVTYDYIIKEASPPDAVGIYSATTTIENLLLITASAANINMAKSARTASGQRIAAVLQAPPKPIAKFGNKKVELKWRWRNPGAVNSYQDLYYGYYIERKSLPDTSFIRLNNMPFTSATSKSDTIVYTDQDTTKANSVLRNGSRYVYRLVGKTYFDDEIMALQTVSGACEDDTRYFPIITKDTLFPITNQVRLTWTYSAKAPANKFKSYAIGRADKLIENTIFQKVPTIGGLLTLDSTVRTATVLNNVTSSTKTAYYVVIGKDKEGKEFTSIPVLIQGVDTLAPAPPTGVVAVWNATYKTATITWNANQESDLLGYKIFRCLPGGSPVAISDTTITKATTFIDTVKIENLKVLYYVIAIDKQFNPSGYSAPGILQKPDLKPPVKPTFGTFKINNKGQIELIIYPSSSFDVVSHRLKRRVDSLETNLKTWTIPDKPNLFKDSTLIKGGIVIYIIEASDSTGNKSSDTLTITVPTVLIAKPQFTIFNSSSSRIDPSIKLNWGYTITGTSNEILEFIILKSDMSIDPTGKLSTWKTVSGDAREVTDYDQIYYERTYKYGVKAVFKDGSSSAWLYTTLTMPTICGAAKYLEEIGKVEPGSNVLKEACSSIRLLPGFHAKRDSVFRGVIKRK